MSLLRDIRLKATQIKGANFLLDGGKIIAMDPGMGKTYTALEAACVRMEEDPELRTVLIVPPTAIEPFKKSFPAVPFECWNAYKNRKVIPSSVRVVMYTYDELGRYVKPMVSTGKWLAIYDEAHLLLDATTNRYKEALEVRELCVDSWGMTGTPLINNIPNLYNFVDFFNKGKLGSCYKDFEDKYLIMDHKPAPVLRRGEEPGESVKSRIYLHFCDDIKNAKELKGLLGSVLYRDVLDYDVEFKPVYCTMSSYQSMQYDKATDGYKDAAGYTITPAARYYNQQEVATGSDPNLLQRADKVDKMIKLVKEIQARGEGVIIYCTSKRTVNLMAQEISSLPGEHYIMTGEMPMNKRLEVQNKLKAGDIIVMDDAGVQSMNLQAVNNIIVAECPWSAGVFTQLVGRIARVDSTYAKKHNYIMITKGTVDQTKWDNICRKLGVQQALFGTSTVAGRGVIEYKHLCMGYEPPVEGSYWDILKEQGLAGDVQLVAH